MNPHATRPDVVAPRAMPQEERFDSTLALLRAPFRYIGETCRRLDTDVFAGRLMLRPAVFMRGPEAAALFSDPVRFVRHGAAPRRLRRVLFGLGGVQELDGEPHRTRKALFLTVLDDRAVARLQQEFAHVWEARARAWTAMPSVVLYDEIRLLLADAVCRWAGVPLPPQQAPRRARQLGALFENAGRFGPRYWRGWQARLQTQAWIAGLIRDIRAQRIAVDPGAAAYTVAWHRDATGLLDDRTAAVELLNLLRPTVACTVWIVFVAHALHAHPPLRAALAAGELPTLWFAQEVRRRYPFFPFVAARVKTPFEWRGMHFRAGTRALLDLYGTDHDARRWARPEAFEPARFGERPVGAWDLIPQGPGEPHVHHRCPGEGVALALMQVATEMLARRLRYDVPAQDLALDETALPPLPRSGFVIRQVQSVAPQRG